jgi:hypothetical protein
MFTRYLKKQMHDLLDYGLAMEQGGAAVERRQIIHARHRR